MQFKQTEERGKERNNNNNNKTNKEQHAIQDRCKYFTRNKLISEYPSNSQNILMQKCNQSNHNGVAPGVEYGFLCACNVTAVQGMYLNVVVIVTYFVAGVMLSLLINDFTCT